MQAGSRPGTVGLPLPGQALKVTDPDTGRPLGPGESGLLWVRGPNVMRGYLGDPERTAEVLRDGWYNTGDVARIETRPCGCGMPGIRFRIMGRADDMLIVKGVNLYPQALKAVIDGLHPRTTGAFRIVLREPGPRVAAPLRVRLEAAAGTTTAERQALEAELVARCRDLLRITPRLEWVAAGTLPRESMKTRYLLVEEPAPAQSS